MTPTCQVKKLLNELFSSFKVQYFQHDDKVYVYVHSDRPSECGIHEFEVLSALFGVAPTNITHGGWEEINPGCDTCAYNRDGFLSFTVEGVAPNWIDNLEAARALIVQEQMRLQLEREEAAREWRRQADERETKKRAEKAAAKLREDTEGAAWLSNKDAIVEDILGHFEEIKTPKKKLFARAVNATPRISNLLYNMWKNTYQFRQNMAPQTNRQLILDWASKADNARALGGYYLAKRSLGVQLAWQYNVTE